MKTKLYLLAFIIPLFTGSYSQAQSVQDAKKISIVYFSHSGNTEEIANQIKDAVGGDILKFQPAFYPSDYQSVPEQAKKEINKGYKPELKTKIDNIGIIK